jgi:Tfp pilus assembly protein PilN
MSENTLIAFVLRARRVEWTVLQRRKHRADIVQQKTVPLDWPEGMDDRQSPEAAAFLKGKLVPLKGRLAITLPADRVLMRVADLPSVDMEELLGMAELQVDKFSPFPSDQMAISLEVLNQGEDRSRVLIAAVQHETIDGMGEWLMQAGLYPQAVDVDVMGWWTLIRDAQQVRAAGQEVVLVFDDGCAQLLVVRDGVPVALRALDMVTTEDRHGAAAELAEEISYTLTTLEGPWGAVSTEAITLWTRGGEAGPDADALAAASGLPVEARDLGVLPPLSEGISRRMAGPEQARLDLSPPGWRQVIQSRKLQRQALGVAVGALAVWLLVMAGIWMVFGRQKQQVAAAQADIARVQAEVEAVRELRSQVESLEQYADRTYSGLECLREIATLLPGGVDLTSVTYNKASQVNLRGESATDGPIYDFLKLLEQSPLFTEVKAEGITTQVRGGQARSVFRVTMMLPAPPEEEAGSGS